MQDNWQEFDRKLASVLQDAEEKAPRRVWRAVSARLGSKAAPVVWWKWAAPAFAFAALALGLVLSGTFRSGKGVPGTDTIIAENGTSTGSTRMQEDPSSASVQEEAPAISGLLAQDVAGASRSYRRHAGSTQAPAVSEVDDITGDSPTEEESVAVSDITPSVPSTEKSDSDNASAEEAAAAWARIEAQENAVRRGVTVQGVYAHGGLGGNDSNLSYGGTGISRLAPGPGSEDTGIGESGSSTYGVPFTLGLGVRFGLGGKLSLGTGLEYSLLTRTFTGTYQSYTGSILHTVQYVGVPINLYYDLFTTREGLLNIYAFGGGTAEVCVGNAYRLLSGPGSVIRDDAGALQFSAALGAGFQFRLSEKLGLYFDPSVRYYFHGNQPKSLRTDKPFMFTVDAGLRFNL